MKLSDLVKSYCQNTRMKGRLVEDIDLGDGRVIKKGTVSCLLIPKGDGEYHFETSDDEAFTAARSDFELISEEGEARG